MKVLYALSLMSVLTVGFASAGCTESHTETDKTGMLGGHTHEETTVTKNPVTGDTSVDKTKTSN